MLEISLKIVYERILVWAFWPEVQATLNLVEETFPTKGYESLLSSWKKIFFRAITRIFRVITQMFRVITRIFRVITRIFRVITRMFRVITRMFRVVTRMFRVITRMFLVWNQYTLFDSSRFIHSDCESSPVKMAMPTGEHCWKKNSGAPWARTSSLRSFGFQV